MYTSFSPVTIKMPVLEYDEFVTVAQIYTKLWGCDDSWFRMNVSAQAEIACFLASQSIDLPLSASRLEWCKIPAISFCL
jgi:hypothetical protein